MGSSISTARLQVQNASGVWTPVGSGSAAIALPVYGTTASNQVTLSASDAVVAAPSPGASVTGTPTANSSAAWTLRGSDASVSFTIGTLTSGTLYFEGTWDGTNWWPVYVVRQGGVPGNQAPVYSVNGAGVYQANTAGMAQVRVRAFALTPPVTVNAFTAPASAVTAIAGALPAGANTIGNVNVVGNGLQSAVAGAISAAIANTPGTAVTASSTGAVVLNANVAGNVSFALVTTAFVGTLIFEASVDAGFNYAPLMCIREDGTGAENSLALSTAVAYIRQYTAALAGVAYFRVRCSVFTSGTVAIVMQPGPSLIEPNPSLGGGTQNIGNVGITNPTAVAGGIYASINPYGSLRVTNEPTVSFFDPFDGATIDTQRWTVSGTSPTQVSGTLLVNASTVASATSRLTSTATFASPGLGFEVFGCVIQVEAAPVVNVYRFWGWGSDLGSPTYQAPAASTSLSISDGVGFELDGAGNLYAVVYASAALQYRSSAIPTAYWGGGTQHRYGIMKRSDVIFWFVEGQDLPVAQVTYKAPTIQTLPIKFGAYNNSSAPAAYTYNVQAVAMHDSTSQNHTFSDPTYPWRRAGVSPAGHLKVAPYSGTPNTVSNAMSTTSANVLPANVNRIGATLTNDPGSAASVYILFGATASTSSYTVILAPGAYYEVPFGYAGLIVGITSGGTATMKATELTV